MVSTVDEKFLYVNKMETISKTNSKIIKIDLSNLSTETIFEGKIFLKNIKMGVILMEW